MFVIKLRSKLKQRARVGDMTTDNTRTEPLSLHGTALGPTVGRQGDNGTNALGDGAAAPSRSNATGTRNRYTKAAVTLGALVAAVNICVLPFVLYSITVSSFCPRCNNGMIRDLLVNILYVNFCLNPILYAATMSKIGRFYKGMFCKRN